MIYRKVIMIFICFVTIISCSNDKRVDLSQTQIINDVNYVINHKDSFKNVHNFSQADFTNIKKYCIKVLDTNCNQTVIRINGLTGCSYDCCSGSLLMVYCGNKLLTVQQTPLQTVFIDLNNDSIFEIYSKKCIMWMKEYGEAHYVYNLNSDKSFLNFINHSPLSFDENNTEIQLLNDTSFKESHLKFKNIDNNNTKDVIIETSYRLWSDSTLKRMMDTIIIEPF